MSSIASALHLDRAYLDSISHHEVYLHLRIRTRIEKQVAVFRDQSLSDKVLEEHPLVHAETVV